MAGLPQNNPNSAMPPMLKSNMAYKPNIAPGAATQNAPAPNAWPLPSAGSSLLSVHSTTPSFRNSPAVMPAAGSSLLSVHSATPSFRNSPGVLPAIPPSPRPSQIPKQPPQQTEHNKKKKNHFKKRPVWKKVITKPFTLFFISAIVLAGFFKWWMDDVYYKNPGFGKPATEHSETAAENFETCLFLIGGLAIVGFIVIHSEITNMLIGLLYMFGLSVGLYFSCSALSSAVYASTYDTFYDVFKYMSAYQAKTATKGQLPPFVNGMHRKKQCCGWSPYFTLVWSTHNFEGYSSDDTDLPDSCCVNWVKGCGKNILSNLSSGYIAPVPQTKVSPAIDDIPLCIDLVNEQTNPNFLKFFSNRMLRALDMLHYINATIKKDLEVPCLIVGYLANPYFYFSFGPEELRRLEGVIHTNSCDLGPNPRISYTQRLNVTNEGIYDKYIYKNKFEYGYTYWTRFVTYELIMPSAVLSGNCLLMAFFFMYYFSKINQQLMLEKQDQAEENTVNSSVLPREFTDYDIDAGDEHEHLGAVAGVISADMRFHHLLDAAEKKKDFELQQQIAQQKLENPQHHHHHGHHPSVHTHGHHPSVQIHGHHHGGGGHQHEHHGHHTPTTAKETKK